MRNGVVKVQKQEVLVNDPLRHPRKTKVRKLLWRDRYLYLLLIPAILYFIIFKFAPMYGVQIAFKDYKINLGIGGSEWVGTKYFQRLFKSSMFSRVFRNTLLLNIYSVIFGFPAPIILALMLNELRSQRYKRVMQSVVYIPHFFSWVILAGMISNLLSPSHGAINQIYKAISGSTEGIYFLTETKWWPTVFIISGIWKDVGWGTIIYLAAISNIDQQLYEAAQIDGCNRFKSILHVTIPGILGTVCLLLIMNVGGLLSSGVSQMWLLRTPGNMAVADTLDVYVLRTGLQNGQFGYASAIGLIQGVVGLVLVVATNSISKRVADVGLW